MGVSQVEKHVSRVSFSSLRKRDLTTGELVRLIYCNTTWDQDFNLRKKGDPPLRVEHWMYERIRKAAPTFADRVGPSTGHGRPWVWRLRADYFHDVRKQKRAEYEERRRAEGSARRAVGKKRRA